eukprot:scaffold345_cov134-Cylindrotheca_fusiformis.AAC.66
MKLSLAQNNYRLKYETGENLSDFQLLVRSIAQNRLVHFKLGYLDNEFRTKRNVQQLVKAVRENYRQQVVADKHSSLETIKIGWNLPSFALAPVLQHVLPFLLDKPSHVRHLELNLDSWVPATTLKRLVSCTSLESLTLRGVRIRTFRMRSDPTDYRGADFDWESSMVEDNIVQILPHLSPTIKTLNLIDCDIMAHHIPRLQDALRKKRQIQSISLRHNRQLDGGWKELFSLPIASLDLSLCDLDPADGHYIAQALRGSHTLKSLNVAGNYRMTIAIPELVEVASAALVELDCSFCEIQNEFQRKVFDIMAAADKCTIQSLTMQGVRIKDADCLIKCLNSNHSLQRLILNHPRDSSKPIDSSSLRAIIQAVEHNYFLKVFEIDVPHYDRKLLKEMDFWLRLNRCGRGVILQDINDHLVESKPWLSVLEDAGLMGDKEVVYWLLTHGSELFTQS